MGVYVKKPIPVEAVKVEEENHDQIISMLEKGVTDWEETEDGFIVHSWEGVEPVKYGSNYWIIKGIKGECYPCEGSVFEESYEAIDNKKKKEIKTLQELGYEKIAEYEDRVMYKRFEPKWFEGEDRPSSILIDKRDKKALKQSYVGERNYTVWLTADEMKAVMTLLE